MAAIVALMLAAAAACGTSPGPAADGKAGSDTAQDAAALDATLGDVAGGDTPPATPDAVADPGAPIDAPAEALGDAATATDDGADLEAAAVDGALDVDDMQIAEVAPEGDVSAVVDAGPADVADGADSAADAAAPSPFPPAKLGFVAMMSGKFGVFDLATLSKVAVIGQGHEHVHGCAVFPGQQIAYIPNKDTGDLDRYEQQGGDPTNWKLVGSYPTGIKMGMLDSTPDGKTIVMSAGNMVIYTPSGQLPKFSTTVKVFSTVTNKTVLSLETSSPNSVAIANDGATAYAGNWLDKTISVIDVAAGAEVDSWPLPTNGPTTQWVGPSRITLSHDGKWMLSCDLTDKAAVLIPVPDWQKAIEVPTPGLAHWCEFAADDKTFYISVWDKLINQGDELGNTQVPATTLAFDTASHKQVGAYKWQYLVAHVAAAPGTPWLFLSGSFGSVLRLDASMQLTGQLIVEPGMPMPAMTISF